jgi:hypothetical protein
MSRFRFQFRLRTLLIAVAVLSIPCAYVAKQAKTVRDRQAAWAKISTFGKEGYASYIDSPLPRIRQWLGDTPIAVIELPSDVSKADLDLIEAEFPEAKLLIVPPGIHLDSNGLQWLDDSGRFPDRQSSPTPESGQQ